MMIIMYIPRQNLPPCQCFVVPHYHQGGVLKVRIIVILGGHVEEQVHLATLMLGVGWNVCTTTATNNFLHYPLTVIVIHLN